jgi:hypothetical protein
MWTLFNIRQLSRIKLKYFLGLAIFLINQSSHGTSLTSDDKCFALNNFFKKIARSQEHRKY